MSTVELKQSIINQVNAIDDESVLTEIHQLLKVESSGIYQLTQAELKAVEEGLEDVKYGRVYPSEQANALIQEWLKK
jgi:predicted transcriptional regulator